MSRGKFKPAVSLSNLEVRDLLTKKIDEEKSRFDTSLHVVEKESLNYLNNKVNTISLFSGCGGLDLGFELAGLAKSLGETKALEIFNDSEKYKKNRSLSIVNTIYVNDIFNDALNTYKRNHQGLDIYYDSSDIRKIKEFPAADLVLGGFPCPGFSEAGPRLIDDERNFLYIQFIRCIVQSKPKVFVAENVKGMMTLGKGEVFKQIVEDFSAAGYSINFKLLDAKDYGVPQTRERVILVGIRKDIECGFSFPNKTHGMGLKDYVSLHDSISDLNHNPGVFFEGSFSTIYLSRNRKKKWNEPSFTIQASGRQAPLHPHGDPMLKVGQDEWNLPSDNNVRRLSIKEIARIQTFPDWYDFDVNHENDYKQVYIDKVYKQIGNAVPVKLAYQVALQVLQIFIDIKEIQ